MLETIKQEWEAKVGIIIFAILTIFWIYLQFTTHKGDEIRTFFGAIYGIMALWGAVWGIRTSLKWGGAKSVMGKAILMFSLGLFAQEFGQVTLSFYHYVYNLEGLYPSLGDLGFFGSIPLYIYGTYLLAKASGVSIRLQAFKSKVIAIILPLIMLALGYTLFLQNYEFDWSHPLIVFLDFGYPLAQAIYISLAILTYLLSKGVLGGIMKNKILFILFALCIQFSSDYVFLFQTHLGTWSVAEINDYMYLAAYFLMTLGLIQFETVWKNLRHQNK